MNEHPHHGAVRAWTEKITLPTYPALAADKNPMFFDSRDIQRSKGNIYPLPFTDQLSNEKEDRDYEAVYLENEYIQVILLPELGGRIFAGLDKTNDYDFFYRHKVIKPALIGLLGPWISGGVEFNWPQHHRPSTFMPAEYSIESQPDGSRTVWMGEHDPLNRTKGMVGVCLHPGKAYVETRVRLYNRTPFPQTFLWWENAGVHINERYQVIFPPDVHYTQFHTKEFVNSYPFAHGSFAGNNYGEGADVSFWANSPNATSFFAAPSRYEFFGGYDHERQAGVVHVASAHISPGKKFFTWGNGPFGHTWQRNLMDDTGEYLELMAGAYTDNQPDFSWIMPQETRTFSQYWFPIQKIGPMKNANLHGALNLEVYQGKAKLGVYATEPVDQARILLKGLSTTLLEDTVDLAPGVPYLREIGLPAGIAETDLRLVVLNSAGDELIQYTPEKPWDGAMPEPYQPAPTPAEISSVEELYLAGLHLEQYRHPVFAPEPYWEEALRHDPGESRVNVASGRLALQRGDYTRAEAHLRTAIQRLTWRNPNPYDGEAHYLLGLALKLQDRLDEAYAALYKSTWNAAWQTPAFYTLAQIDCLRGDWTTALKHLDLALRTNTQHLQARDLKAAVLRRLDLPCQAGALVEETLALDPLDAWARFEGFLAANAAGKGELCHETYTQFLQTTRGDVLTALDVAYDYTAAGLWDEAINLLLEWAHRAPLYPMVAYTIGWIFNRSGQAIAAQTGFQRGSEASPDYCFPVRLEEMCVLQEAIRANPQDARAHYYLGNLLYDKKRHAEAVEHWKTAADQAPGLSIPLRNLGLAAFNLERDPEAARQYYIRALQANSEDPRILLELDQLHRRMAFLPEDRLALLDAHRALVDTRDDLTLEWAALKNRLGQPEQALAALARRIFHPWEGGEGSVADQYTLAHLLLGRQSLDNGNPAQALAHFSQGLNLPTTLGEAPSTVDNAPLMYFAGQACEAMGRSEEAQHWYQQVIALPAWPVAVQYYKALALQQTAQDQDARQALETLLAQATADLQHEPQPQYFYQILPNPVFDDDMARLNAIHSGFLVGLAHLGLGQTEQARAAFQQVLALDPSHTLAWEAYRRS